MDLGQSFLGKDKKTPSWRGVGALIKGEVDKAKTIVQQVHEHGPQKAPLRSASCGRLCLR